ncbi:hypothetical protein WBJ53_18870 [Spirosoma sp. SC4-14]|uniref:hypothetical protein n=1 Tax=Spirosoma sp. SC4-14 TaxID=3128900 RepID=UPI0030D47A3E
MKTTNPKIRLLFYGVCLATVLYNCKTKDVAAVTPFTYTFKGLDDVTIPDITQTTPASVSVTAATVTSSTLASAVNNDLAGIAASGVVPASVQQAGTDISKAVSASQAAQLSAAFTPSVLSTLASGGALPADLKAQVDAIASNPALKAYLPTFTLPTVNGKAVGGRLGATTPGASNGSSTAATAYATTADDDACKAAANAAYNAALATLDAKKATQTATVTTTYSTAAAAIAAETAPCKAGIPAKYDPMKTAAQQTLNNTLASLEAAKTTLGSLYDLLKAFAYVSYAQTIAGITTLEAAETTACDSVASAKLAAAAAARDTDLAKINTNYAAAVATLTTARDKAVASCHNQGGGRVGAE